MFMGRTTNNSNNVNVNTRLYTSYSDTAMISLGAWNTQLSLKFHPVKGVNADGIRQYAQDNTEIINTSITVDNAAALLAGIKKEITPALTAGSASSVSIAMGIGDNRKVLTLATDGKDVSLSIAVGVDQNGVVAESNVLTHKFNKRDYMVGYNPSTGTGTQVSVNADYENFVKKVESIYDLAPTVAHSINYNNALKANYSNRQASNNNEQSNYSAPVTNYSGENMESFLPFNQ